MAEKRRRIQVVGVAVYVRSAPIVTGDSASVRWRWFTDEHRPSMLHACAEDAQAAAERVLGPVTWDPPGADGQINGVRRREVWPASAHGGAIGRLP